MKAKDIPPMRKALADLSPYFPTFYDAFESGTDHAKSVLQGIPAPYDPWLHAHLVRHWVKCFLLQRGMDTEEYMPENLANSGLQLSLEGWFIRVRKSAHGEIPPPGRSRVQYCYYQQILPKEFGDMHNLLLLWNATAQGDFKGLSLVYPLSASLAKWRAEIPHPALTETAKTSYQSAFDEFGDLDIEPLGEEEMEEEEENFTADKQ